jgi:hypothetical protein
VVRLSLGANAVGQVPAAIAQHSGVALDLNFPKISGAMRLRGERERSLQRFEIGCVARLPAARTGIVPFMRRRDLEIEQADRRGRKTQRRHRGQEGRLHDSAKGHSDRSFHLVQRGDRIVIRCRGNLHDERLSLDGLAQLRAFCQWLSER